MARDMSDAATASKKYPIHWVPGCTGLAADSEHPVAAWQPGVAVAGAGAGARAGARRRAVALETDGQAATAQSLRMNAGLRFSLF